MLTDGEPNNSFTEQSTLGLMNNSLSGGSVSMGSSCNSNLLSTGSVFASSAGNKPAWECIGEYSQSLINVGNPKKIPIRTAVVGFGSVYKTIENIMKYYDILQKQLNILKNTKNTRWPGPETLVRAVQAIIQKSSIFNIL